MSKKPNSNPNPPTPSNHNPPRRHRPRVRQISSRFMSPATSTPSLRRSQTDLRPRFSDENRSDSFNSSFVSPARSSKPRSVVKLFNEPSRSDTPVTIHLNNHSDNDNVEEISLIDGECESIRVLKPCFKSVKAKWDDHNEEMRSNDGECESIKILKPCFKSVNNSNNSKLDDNNEEMRSIEGNCESIRLEQCEIMVLTPSFKSVNVNGMGGKEEKGVRGTVKVSQSLKSPPMPGYVKSLGTVEVKKAVRKGTSSLEDVHRVKLMYNHYLQWRFANAKAVRCNLNKQKQNEVCIASEIGVLFVVVVCFDCFNELSALQSILQKQLYSLGVKISDLRESVKSKRIEYDFLKQMKTLSSLLHAQMPHLDEWSTLEESYSSSLLELSNGLLNVLSQVPLVGSVRADTKEIEEALNSALKATKMICEQVQSFMPKAENVDSLVFELARVYNREVTRVGECGDLLSKTHLSQVEECSLRGQLMQLHGCKLDQLKDCQMLS